MEKIRKQLPVKVAAFFLKYKFRLVLAGRDLVFIEPQGLSKRLIIEIIDADVLTLDFNFYWHNI